MKTSPYVAFDVGQATPSGKTKIWRVYNSESMHVLGEVRWAGRWRKYAFFPSADVLFDPDCLFTIAEFCEQRTKEHHA